MSNVDDTSSITLRLINNFNLFLKIFENTQWSRKATPEMIKNAFKLASFTEKVMEILNSKGMSNEFLQVFKDWLSQNEQRSMMYEMDFFEFASDHILEVLLFNRAVAITSADIALRIYTSLNSVERLHAFLKDRILKHSSYDVLLKSFIELTNDSKEIEARMMIKDWEKVINEGGIDNVRTSICEMFSNYRLSKSLHVLLKILCILPENDSKFIDVRNIITEKLQEKLADHSILNKDFWNYLFKELDPSILGDVCLNNVTLIDMLFSFIVYTGSMMSVVWKNSQKTWIANEEFSLFPDIEYEDLFKIIKKLHGLNNEIRKIVTTKISDALKNSSSEMWEDILFSL